MVGIDYWSWNRWPCGMKDWDVWHLRRVNWSSSAMVVDYWNWCYWWMNKRKL